MSSFEERLKLFNPDYFTQNERELVVREVARDGEAAVRFQLPPDRLGLAFKLDKAEIFSFLNSRKAGDGFLLVQDKVGCWAGHVVECKKTANVGQLNKAAEQLRMSLVRLQIIADFLNIEVTTWRAWIAFRRGLNSSTDPALLRAPVGGQLNKRQKEHQSAIRMWRSEQIDDVPIVGTLALGKIKLDESGEGVQEL